MKTAKPSSTRAHTQEGGREGGGNKDSQPQQNNGETRGKTIKGRQQARGAHNKQAERRQKKGGRCGKKPNPGTQKGKQCKAEEARKQKK